MKPTGTAPKGDDTDAPVAKDMPAENANTPMMPMYYPTVGQYPYVAQPMPPTANKKEEDDEDHNDDE